MSKKPDQRRQFKSFSQDFLFANRRTRHVTGGMAQVPDELIPTRATLLHRLKDWQDHSSWQDFFDTYSPLIYGIAIQGGLTKSEAQETVQETMIAVAKSMPDFKYNPAGGSFKCWLLNLTRWRITDQFRKRGPQAVSAEPALPAANPDADQPAMDPAGPESACPNSELETLWDAEWEKNLLENAIARAKRQLDPKQYQIFDFCVNKEWPPERIAKTFAITVNQVYLAKHRVVEKIKQEVERLQRQII
jgi:RNA polymerase sigma-70 factor (ECF subfamily)